LYIDFSKQKDFEYNIDDLLRTVLNAPLFEKPPVGENQFSEIGESPPDRTSDGVKQLMKALAEAYNGVSRSYLFYSEILDATDMHRLTLDKYFLIARDRGLVSGNPGSGHVSITSEGRKYIEVHGIIDA